VIDSLLIILPGLIWGASFLFIAEGLEAVSPSGVAFVRILIGFVTLTLVPAVRRPILKSDRARIVILGIIWIAFPLNMFPLAEQHVSSALAGMLNGAVPLFVAAVTSGIARRAPQRAVLIGLLVGFLGAILIALPGLTASVDAGGQTLGVLLILAALVSYGFAYSLSGPLQQRNGALPVIWRALGVAVVRAFGTGRAVVVVAGSLADRARRRRNRHRLRHDGDCGRAHGCHRRVGQQFLHPGRRAGTRRQPPA
jgi:drug/metabolite transporter (DMT)-like permease